MLNIRKANLEDIAQLSVLFNDYRIFYHQASDLTLAETYLAARMKAQESVIFVAEWQGELSGFSQLYPTFCSVACAPYFVLYDLFVAKSARRQGAAEALLKASAEFAREQGADRLELATAIDNTQAQELYEKCGWELDQTFFHYALPLRT